MTHTSQLKTTARLERLVGALPKAEYRLDALFIYEDRLTQKWAGAVCQQAGRVAGKRAFHGTWWKLDDLQHPGVLAGAVSKALRADLIVVATRATESLPFPFYVWVNSWLPHHPPGRTLLVASLARPQQKSPYAGRVRKYLRAVARQGRLDFVVTERPVPTKAPQDNGWFAANLQTDPDGELRLTLARGA